MNPAALVILAPERVLPGRDRVEVLQLCDGVRSVGAMIDQLATNTPPNAARSQPTSSPCAGPRRQGILERSAREDFMSPTLGNAGAAPALL